MKVTGSSSAAPAGCIESDPTVASPTPSASADVAASDPADGSTVPLVTTPPQAPREPHEHTEHGVVRADPYHWMRRDRRPRAARSPRGRATLVRHCHRTSELPGRDAAVRDGWPECPLLIAQSVGDSRTVPTTRCSPREENITSCCGKGTDREYPAPRYCSTSTSWPTSRGTSSWGCPWSAPTRRRLAYSVDRTGDEVYELRFRDLETGAGPARGGAAHLLRRGVEQRTRTTSSTRSTTTPTAPSRCGGTRSARRWPTTCSCSRSRTSASS